MHHNLDFDSCLQIIMQSMAFSKLKFFKILFIYFIFYLYIYIFYLYIYIFYIFYILFIYLYILYILFKNELTHLLINELL